MRRPLVLAALLAAGLLLPAAAEAQRNTPCQPGTTRARAARPAGETPAPRPALREYDVVVEVPNLCVGRLNLDVDNLDAHLSLNARVANLLRVNAGADVAIGNVELALQGVRAEALLLVDLDNVVQVVDQVLTLLDNNPEILNQLVGTVGSAVSTVGNVANTALQPGGVASQAVGAVGQTLGNLTQPGGVLSQTVNAAGQTVQTTLDATGGLVERTLDTAGNVVGTRNVGNLLRLPVLRESTNAAGQTVRQVRGQAGNVIEYTLDSAGRVLNARTVGER